MFGGDAMKKRITSILVILTLALSMICTNAFVVNTKAVPNEKKISKIVDGLKDSVDNYHKTHIKNKDGSRTVLTEDVKKTKSGKKKGSLPSSYVAPYTSVKNQGNFGACWMFAEVGSLESNLLSKENYQSGLVNEDPIDLSEAQGVYTQYNRQTLQGTIQGEYLPDSDNDKEKNSDSYYGYGEGGWQFDASMAESANKASALESDNPYTITGSSNEAKAADSLSMANVAAANYRLNRFDIKSAEGLTDVFSVTGSNERVYNPEARNIWKQKIIDNGAISSNYHQSASKKYNRSWGRDSSNYHLGPDFWIYDADVNNWYGTNHVITIVGFNDNYSRFHYATKYTSQSYDSLVGEVVYIKVVTSGTPDMEFDSDGSVSRIETSDSAQTGYEPYIVPKEDGAWIIKNSYGTTYDNKTMYDNGIMYMSYCEETLAETVSSVVEEDLDQIQNSEKKYDTTLSHSSLKGEVGNGFDSGAKAAEIYTIDADKDIEIGQVGYWTGIENTTSRVQIYNNLSDVADPESGTLIYDSNDLLDAYEGYHTRKLNTPVTLSHGTKASVVISQEKSDKCVITMELDYSNPNLASYFFNSNRGDTFYYDGDEWTDSKDFDEEARTEGYTVGNSTVKLFGNAKEVEPETTTAANYTVTVDGNSTEVEGGQSFTFPTSSENGYANSDYSTLYASGQTITVNSDITVTSIGAFDFGMEKGAAIRLEGDDGIRFVAHAEADSDLLTSSNVECGTLITTADILDEQLRGNLTIEKLNEMEQSHPGKYYGVRVVNVGWYCNEIGRFSAGIIRMNESNFARDFVANAYVKITYSDNSSKIIYSGLSDYRSIVYVAKAIRDGGYQGCTQEEIERINRYIEYDE